MTEMTWTTMRIGGSLPADRVEELIERIAEDFHDLAEGPFDPDEDESMVHETAKKGESLLVQGQVNYGNPDAVIALCIEHDLTYWLHFDAGPEWDSGVQIWSPGADRVEECPASAQGYSPMVDLSTLRIWAKSNLSLQHVIDETARFEAERVPSLTIIEVTEAEKPKTLEHETVATPPVAEAGLP